MRAKLLKITLLAVICCGVITLLGGDSTYAATKTWTGGGDGTTMSDPGNWSDGITPANGDNLVFDDAYVSWPNIDNDIVGWNVNSITLVCTNSNSMGAHFYGNNSLSIASAITNSNCDYAYFGLDADVTLTGNVALTAADFSSTSLDIGPHTLTITAFSDINTPVIGTGVINVSGAPVSTTTSDIIDDIMQSQIELVLINDLSGFSGTVNVNTFFLVLALPNQPVVINVNSGGSLAIEWQPGNITATINVYSPYTSMFLICQHNDCSIAPLALSDINLFTDTTIGLVIAEDIPVVVNKIDLAGLNHNGHCLNMESIDIHELVSGVGSDMVPVDSANFFTGIAINPPCGSVPTVPDVGRVSDGNNMLIFSIIAVTLSSVLLVGGIVWRVKTESRK